MILIQVVPSLDSQPISRLNVSTEFFLDDVQCVGNEDSLLNCNRNTLGDHNCNEFSGAGVRCEGMHCLLLGCMISVSYVYACFCSFM